MFYVPRGGGGGRLINKFSGDFSDQMTYLSGLQIIGKDEMAITPLVVYIRNGNLALIR